MKKIIITGHSSGIGAALYSGLAHDCMGFSRSTGTDIGTPEGKQQVLDALDSADVFINNAYNFSDDDTGWGNDDQLQLIQMAYNKFYPDDYHAGFVPMKDNARPLLINIGSMTANLPEESIPSKNLLPYRDAKIKQWEYIKNRRIVNISPGLTKSNKITGALASVANDTQPIVDAVKYVMDCYFKHNVVCNSLSLL